MAIEIKGPQRISASSTVLGLTEVPGPLRENKPVWIGEGIYFYGFECGSPCIKAVDLCALPDTSDWSNVPGRATYTSHEFKPFVLRWETQCTTAGIWANFDEFKKEGEVAFNSSVHKSLAAGIWEGPGNATGLVDVPVSGQLSNVGGIVIAFGKLSQKLASVGAGSQGVFHMTTFAANLAASKNLLYRRGTELRTVVGDHLVIADGGYSGTAPGNVAPGVGYEWMYATGPMGYMLSPVDLYNRELKDMNRRSNNINVMYESFGLGFWDKCSWFGVPVNYASDLA